MSDKHYVHAPETTKLEELMNQAKPWVERNATALIYAAAGIIFTIAVIIFFNRGESGDTVVTQDLMAATQSQQPSFEAFRSVADNASESEIGIWARLRQADLMLAEATEMLYTNRSLASEKLDAADTAFENLANRSDLPSSVRERVLVGQARITESRCNGSAESIKDATAAWQRVLDEYPDSAVFRTLAEGRIERLSRESTADFYQWFAMQDPSPNLELEPQDGAGTSPPAPPVSTGSSEFSNSLLNLDPGSLAPGNTDPLSTLGSSPAESSGSDDGAEGSETTENAPPETGSDAPANESSSGGDSSESDE